MALTDEERTYLQSQPLGRIATATPGGEPDVAAVSFTLNDDDTVDVGGLDITKTVKYRNVVANGRAALVVDDLATVDPWRPRGLKLQGAATVYEDGAGKAVIRIHPEKVWSWGLNADAEPYFAGIIEKRSA